MTTRAIKQWLRHYFNPIADSVVPIGTCSSPLDAKAERIGGTIVETLAARPDIAAIGAAFDRFLGEERGTLALKKALHIVIEERLRALSLGADPPESHGFGPLPRSSGPHPLDRVAAASLDIATLGQPKWYASPALTLSAIIQGTALLARAFWIGCAKTLHNKPTRRFGVGAPAFANSAYWAPVRRAIAEERPAKPNDLAVVIENNYANDPGDGIPVIRPAECAIDRMRWWREVVWPSVRLVAFLFIAVLRRPLDPVTATAAWYVCHLVRTTLDFRRVLHSVTFDNYLDITEYSASHIVKAALLKREGGRLVRWPYCYLDNPGATLSYLGYHHWLGTGPYEFETYGDSWAPDCKIDSVGFFKNDHRWFTSETQLSSEIAGLIEKQHVAGRRLLVYFGPSAIPNMTPIVQSTVAAIANAIADAPEWFLVVKAKGYGAFQMVTDAIAASDVARSLETKNRLVVVPYSTGGEEVCSAGWLIERMAAGVGLGSVQLEGLTQGKPVFSFMPVAQETPYQQQLSKCGLAHTDPSALRIALERWMSGADAPGIPFSWFRAAFDPFSDNQALSRIVGHIWAHGSETKISNIASTSQ